MTQEDAGNWRAGIGRSFDIYYRDAARTRRMDALNRRFVRPGGLVFDVGAHVGDRTASFLRLGASVVALEPQPRVFRALRLLHGRQAKATLLPWAVGQDESQIVFYLNRRNPTVATASAEFIDAASGAQGWEGQVWDQSVTVPMTTLDALIARFGSPDFIKIDVEGHEADVLAGLSVAVPALSFEFTTIQKTCAHDCIDRLSALGPYHFNLSLGEEHALRYPGWVTTEVLKDEIEALPEAANSGDVYARL
ncbi:FkbM family methyltransferase [Cognatishimia sp. MH4019]|uniref:FkbM family methyltransferase n=1 Tax=Cognatishimia sp. MH4019 TaxID=2854030 RepID=UPI001CD1F8E5|nr:FkbM family methyltransferase [Cognatishimia sp. MH4019]